MRIRASVSAVVFLACGSLSAQPPAAIDPALAAAIKREELFRTVEFTFSIDETAEPGSQSAMAKGSGKWVPFPATQIRRQSAENRLLMDGNRYRYESNHPIPDERIRGWAESRDVEVCDGTTTKYFSSPPGNAKRLNSIAIIRQNNTMLVGGFPVESPIYMFCRGNSERHEWTYRSMRKFLPTGQVSVIQGKRLLEYRGQIKYDTQNFTCWVDPTTDYVVRRLKWNYVSSDKTKNMIDIRYDLKPGDSAVRPSGWTITSYAQNGKVSRSYEVTVDSVSRNPSVAAERFDIVFPPGLEVSDQRNGTYHLVREDGSWFRLARAGQKLDSIEDELEKSWYRRNVMWIALGLSLPAFAFLALRWRARRRHAATQ